MILRLHESIQALSIRDIQAIIYPMVNMKGKYINVSEVGKDAENELVKSIDKDNFIICLL